MAADYSAYDAGTAYLTVKAKLDDNIEADLATQLQGIHAVPVALTADLAQFADDLDAQWGDLDHPLKVRLEPEGFDELNGGEPLKIDVSLNTDEAETQLRAFYSLIPIYTIPVMLNTDVAEAQLEELRAKALEPLTIPVGMDQTSRGETAVRQGLTSDAAASRTSAQAIIYQAARQNPAMAMQEIMAAASANAPQAAQQLLATAAAQPLAAATGSPFPTATPGSAGPSSPAQRQLEQLTASLHRAQIALDTAGEGVIRAQQHAQLSASTEQIAQQRLEELNARSNVLPSTMMRAEQTATSAGFGVTAAQREIPRAAARYEVAQGTVDTLGGRVQQAQAKVAAEPGTTAQKAQQDAQAKTQQDAQKALQESESNVAKGFTDLGKNLSVSGLFKNLPMLSGKGGWGEVLGSGGAGSAAGAEAASAAAGAAAAALTALLQSAKQAAEALINLAAQAAKYAMIGGAVGLGGGLAAQAGAVGITGYLGSKNVGTALSAGSALRDWQLDPNAQLQQSQAVASANQEQITTAQGLQKATWDVEDATFSGATAQAQLTMSQQNAVLAQRSLNEAYMDAGRQVRDMNSALTDAKLAQEGAAISVAEARRNLMQTDMNPASDLVDRQNAQFEYQSAIQRYTESKNKTADQTVDTSISNQRGVTGSTQVLQATQGMQQAVLGVSQALQGILDSQHQVTAAIQGVQAASFAVAQAATTLKLALNPQPVNDYNLALSKLPQSARDFVTEIQSMRPEMLQLEQAIGSQLFSGLSDSIKNFVDTQGLGMSAAMTGIAQGINSGLKQTLVDVGNLFTQLQRDGTWDQFVTGAENLAKNISPVITGVLDLLMQLGAKTAPVVGPLLQQLGQSLQQIGPALGELGAAFGKGLTDALPSLTDMFVALAGTGTEMMPALSTLFQTIADAVTQVAPEIGPFVSALATDFAQFIGGLTSSGGMKTLADDFVLFAQNMGPLMEPLGRLVGLLLPKLLDVVTSNGPEILKLVDDFGKWYDKAAPVIDVIGSFVEHGLPGLTGVLKDIAIPLNVVVGAFETWWGWLDKILSGVGSMSGLLKDLFGGGTSAPAATFGGGGGDGTYAVGGPVRGAGTGTSDSIHAMVSDGEYIVNARAAAQHAPLLDQINYGTAGFAVGGFVKAGSSALLASDVHQGKYAKTIRRIAERAMPGFASGGPVNARQWGIDHPNIPYIWGGAEIGGVDCSGYVSLLQQVAMGVSNPSARLGVAGDAVSGAWPRLVKGAGAQDLFVIGANADHMAAAILGTNFEARQPGENVRVGPNAASPFGGQFTAIGHVDPQAFQPAYAAGGTGTQAGVDQNAAGTDKTAAEAVPFTTQAPTTWSGWAGDTTTNVLMSLAQYGTPFPNPSGFAAGPVQGLSNAFTGTVKGAPQSQQQWLSEFLFGSSAPPSDQVSTGTAAAGSTPAVSTPANPNAGTANAAGTAANDALASETPGGGVLGALQHAVGGFAKAAGAAVSGQISDALGVLGGGSSLDQVPGWVAAGYQLYMLGQQQPGTAVAQTDPTQQQSTAPGGSATSTAPIAPTVPTPTPGTPGAPLNKMAQPGTGAAAPQTGGDSLNAMAQPGTAAGALPPLHTYNPGQGVSQWTSTFAGVLNSLGLPQAWLQLGMDQMQTESSGNPQAINTTDSNAAAGTPSKGLMQVIDPTFGQEFPKFSAKGYPNDVWDPRSNIAAGLEWVMQADGGTPVGTWGMGHGYATGGDVSGDGSSLGDMIPAMLSDGEFVMNAQSADANHGLLSAMNTDAQVVNRLNVRQMIPAKGLVGAGTSRGGMDNSATYNIHAADTEQGFRRAALYQQQRAATYTGRWR